MTTIMATIQRINIIGSREGSRNRRRLKANQTGKKFRVGIKSNISTNRNNLISGVDRSEERRVGKECRCRRWRDDEREKKEKCETGKRDEKVEKAERGDRCEFFFFKQKTAYEIGLGIPAEPLFRSKGKDTRDYLAAAFPELNAWERAGADASSAGMVDAGFENQKELTKMQLDNQKEIAEMQNETQK